MKKKYIKPDTMYSSIGIDSMLMEGSITGTTGLENPPTAGSGTAPSDPGAKDYFPKASSVWDE